MTFCPYFSHRQPVANERLVPAHRTEHQNRAKENNYFSLIGKSPDLKQGCSSLTQRPEHSPARQIFLVLGRLLGATDPGTRRGAHASVLLPLWYQTLSAELPAASKTLLH